MTLETYNSPEYKLNPGLDLETVTQTLANKGWTIKDNIIVPSPLKFDSQNNPIYMKGYPVSEGVPTPAAVIELQEGKVTEIRVGSWSRAIQADYYPQILAVLKISSDSYVRK